MKTFETAELGDLVAYKSRTKGGFVFGKIMEIYNDNKNNRHIEIQWGPSESNAKSFIIWPKRNNLRDTVLITLKMMDML